MAGRPRCRGREGRRTSTPRRPQVVGQAHERVYRAWRIGFRVGFERAAFGLRDGVDELASAFENQPLRLDLEMLYAQCRCDDTFGDERTGVDAVSGDVHGQTHLVSPPLRHRPERGVRTAEVGKDAWMASDESDLRKLQDVGLNELAR